MIAARILALSAALVGSVAPYQCAGEANPARRIEETPGEALYTLAEQFHDSGNENARVATLRYLIARYPTSRFAVMARQDVSGSPSDARGAAK